MVGGWVKLLHCESKAFDNVHHGQYQKRLLSSTSSSSSSSASSFSSLYSFGCKNSAQTIKDRHRHRQAAAAQEAQAPAPTYARTEASTEDGGDGGGGALGHNAPSSDKLRGEACIPGAD
ncbi:hypothetical protein NL676_032903 [Syzygium grande]|nr:hypothetical protein NL676_032903 [Syzygium grande]